MKKRVISLLLALVLILAVFVGCEKKTKILTQDEAIKVALKDANLSSYDDAHAHITTQDGAVCFSIHITVDDTTYNYVIAAEGGKIISSGIEEVEE